MRNNSVFKIALLLLVVLQSNPLFSQDTIWLDNLFRRVDRSKATEMEVREWQEDSARYKITRAKITGELLRTYQVLDTIKQLKDGYYLTYHPNQQLQYKMLYLNNKLHGRFVGFYENGITRRVDFYRNDSLISGNCYSRQGKDTLYIAYWVKPKFMSGSLEDFSNYLGKNVVYPKNARKQGAQGRVYVNFVVEKNGAITNVVVRNKTHPDLDKEAIRVVKKSEGLWQCGYVEGKPARIAYTVPINFKLQ